MTPVWDDPRVAAGARTQLALRDRLLADGATGIGWKVAFSAPAALANFRLEAAVVGFLLDRWQLPAGTPCPVTGWKKPALEPEIAIHMAADLPAGASAEEASAAIAGLSAAIEIADVDLPLDDLEPILAANIFHRWVVLGPLDTARAGGDGSGIAARVEVDGELVAEEADPVSVVGTPVAVARHVADLLAATGAGLAAGDVIISGSVVPMLFVSAGQRVSVHLDGLDDLAVDFTEGT